MAVTMPENSFKDALVANELQLGAFLGLGDATGAELMATTNFDWLLIDGEHGPNDIRTILSQLQAVSAYSTCPVVRTPDHNSAYIKRLLDLGAQTLLAPMVESVHQAEQLVSAIHYPPDGIRGVGGGLTRATRWGGIEGYMDAADENMCLIVQIENQAGLEDLEAITSVEGVDGVFLGPADLAAALGYPGQPGHPEVCKVVEDTMQRIHALGKPVGAYCGDPQQAERYRGMGASFFLIAADTMLLKDAANSVVERFRS